MERKIMQFNRKIGNKKYKRKAVDDVNYEKPGELIANTMLSMQLY
jgi:hypothetical protein